MSKIQLPSTRQPVVEQAPNGTAQFTVPWYRFLNSLLPSGAAAAAIALGVSPYSYTAAQAGTIFVSGGTVSLIEYGRNGVFTNTGVVAGPFPIFVNDVLRVTYTVLPNMTFVRA